MQKLTVILVLLSLAIGVNADVSASTTEPGSKINSNRAPRIFVTKVYPSRGNLTSTDFEQLADAGFTTVAARWKENITAYAQGAAAAGLDSMSWEAGIVGADVLGEPHVVNYKGKETKYSVPYSHAAWQNRTQLLVNRAKLSVACPRFKGVLLDFEIYGGNKAGGFAESYDEDSFKNFLTKQGQAVPNPLTAPGQRKKYLSSLGLHKEYIAWQYDLVATEVIKLRQAVDAINPNFQIGVYAHGPLLKAVMENVATSTAPVLLLNAATYGRAKYRSIPGPGYNKTQPDRIGLKWSLKTNAKAAKRVPQVSYPAIYLGGHDPMMVGTGDSYKFTVRQAFNSVAYGTGYWIWTEWAVPKGWGRQDWIDSTMDYFKKAHNALDVGDFAWASRQPVQIADPNATTPLIVLTTDDAISTIKAWDALTGRQITITENPGVTWTATALGDVDSIAGDERVDIADGYIVISDPTTQIQLLRFFVGSSQTKMQLITGTPQKLRVLVDKILTRNSKELSDQQAQTIAKAGFNVVSPRYAATDEQTVRKIAEITQRHNLGYMPWIRGTHRTTQEPKLVWANGVVQNIYSPNSDELWKLFTTKILTFAKVSVDYPALRGVLLDYEIYVPNKQGTAYALSYDQKIIHEFSKAKKIDIPDLPPADRWPWLKENDLHDEFSRFQVESWRQRCRALRKAIDQFNPRFQFGIYPGGSTFIDQALFHELATPDAPAIYADASTYSRPSILLNHKDSLKVNRNHIQKVDERTRQSSRPLLCMGGIDPILKGADPEFSGKNASSLAEASDGYWIFYELQKAQRPDHPEYWKWFSKANHQIAKGEFTLWQEPRQTPDIVTETPITAETDRIQLAFYGIYSKIRESKMREMVEGTGRYEVHALGALTLEYLKQFKLIVLQNFNVAADADSKLGQTLRSYVEQGGSLMFTHDTILFMESPFPEIAKRDMPSHQVNVAGGKHVVDTPLKVVQAHPAIAGVPVDTTFVPGFRDHMIFKSGPNGTVIIKNELGDPTYVVGKCARGRVAFVGSYYGYHNTTLEGPEKQVFLALVKWLTVRQ